MPFSILIPAYARPEQLGEALASLARQEPLLIGEIIIGDDSPPEFWPRNRQVIADSGLAHLVDYVASDPPKGTYPNQWFLASRARFDHLLFLHNDDLLSPGGLRRAGGRLFRRDRPAREAVVRHPADHRRGRRGQTRRPRRTTTPGMDGRGRPSRDRRGSGA